MAHMHITSWVLAILLLILVVVFYKKEGKAGKILHMVLRLDYLFILYTGISLMINYFTMTIGHTGELVVKIIAGLWAIFAMEMIAVRTGKHVSTKGVWIQFAIAAAIAIILGFTRLPLGVLP